MDVGLNTFAFTQKKRWIIPLVAGLPMLWRLGNVTKQYMDPLNIALHIAQLLGCAPNKHCFPIYPPLQS
jgi:hypothetical protein